MSTAIREKKVAGPNTTAAGTTIKEIWETYFGPWEDNRPKGYRSYRTMKYDQPVIDPKTLDNTKYAKPMPYPEENTQMQHSRPRNFMATGSSQVTINGVRTNLIHSQREEIGPKGEVVYIADKIKIENGVRIVDPMTAPELIWFMDLTPQNAESPCYWEYEEYQKRGVDYHKLRMKNPKSGEMRPGFRTHYAEAIAHVDADRSVDEQDILFEIYRGHNSENADWMESIHMKFKMGLPAREIKIQSSVKYLNLLRQNIKVRVQDKKSNLAEMLEAVKNHDTIQFDKVRQMEDAQLLRVVNGEWHHLLEGTPVAIPPMIPTDENKYEYLYKFLNSKRHTLWAKLEGEYNRIYKGIEPSAKLAPKAEHFKDGKIVLKKSGWPNLLYVLDEFKDLYREG